MTELAMKQNTVPNRMGNQSALSSVMTISPDLANEVVVIRRRAFCSGSSRRTTACGDYGARPHCAMQRFSAALLALLLFASSWASGEDIAQSQRDLIDAQIARFPSEPGA